MNNKKKESMDACYVDLESVKLTKEALKSLKNWVKAYLKLDTSITEFDKSQQK